MNLSEILSNIRKESRTFQPKKVWGFCNYCINCPDHIYDHRRSNGFACNIETNFSFKPKWDIR